MKYAGRGFLLIELSIVLALLAIAVGLCLINLSWVDHYTVKMELEKLCAVCHYLQQRAVARNQEETLTFDAHNNRYSYDNSFIPLSSGVCFGYITNSKGPPSNPSIILHDPINFQKKRISFHPDGTVQAGTVYLVDHKKLHMYAMTINIAHGTYIRKYRYDKQWTLIA